jgi:phosphatidate cytidylyltransferase
MKMRIIASVVIGILLVAALLMGQTTTAVLAGIVCALAMYEYLNVVFHKKKIDLVLTIILGIIIYISVSYRPVIYSVVITFSVMSVFIYDILKKQYEINEIMHQIFSLIYIPLPLGLVVNIFSIHNGYILVWLIFLVACATDTMAYFIGISMGKKRLCPAISPKKSVEGALAGLVSGIAVSILGGIIFTKYFHLAAPIWHYAVVGALGSTCSQFGDLSASLIKRKFNKKDFGNILPGHGGILDRIDSILFVIPIIYFYALIA